MKLACYGHNDYIRLGSVISPAAHDDRWALLESSLVGKGEWY
jgi:hypothetical protein